MKSLVFVCLLVMCQQGLSSKLRLAVFYESKCPDSRRFISELLLALNQFQDNLDLTLIPFGKASSRIENGRRVFQCQHGPSECRGNLMQECALYHMEGRSDIEKVAYVDCEMQTLSGTTGDLTCVRRFNVPESLVQRCVSSGEGIKLQLISERATKRISPSFIPSITVNGNFIQQIQDSAIRDLPGTLCELLYGDQVCA